MKKVILFCAVATLLAACGGGGGGGNPVAITLPPPLNTGGSGDAFIDVVVATVNVSMEDKEAVAIDSVTATSPDDASPIIVI